MDCSADFVIVCVMIWSSDVYGRRAVCVVRNVSKKNLYNFSSKLQRAFLSTILLHARIDLDSLFTKLCDFHDHRNEMCLKFYFFVRIILHLQVSEMFTASSFDSFIIFRILLKLLRWVLQSQYHLARGHYVIIIREHRLFFLFGNINKMNCAFFLPDPPKGGTTAEQGRYVRKSVLVMQRSLNTQKKTYF